MNFRSLKIMFAIMLIFFCFSLADKPALAAPSRRVPITVSQPSGEKFKAILYGDEKFNWWAAENGEAIIKGKGGYWYYSNIVSGKIQASQSKYLIDSKPLSPLKSNKILELKNEGKIYINSTVNTMNAAPLMGSLSGENHKILTLLVQFPDVKIQNSDTIWSNQFFNMSQDSVNKYYDEVSGGKFHFYPAEEASGTANDGIIKVALDYNHPNTNQDTGFLNQKLVSDALTKANDYINYQSFDTDKNGYISTDELHIVTIVAGYEASYMGDKYPSVWGHRWSFDYDFPLSLDGVGLCNFSYGGGYTQQGEIHNDHMATIGILTHELAHDLGLPDLYDYDDSSLGAGIHSLMADGSWARTTGYPGTSPTHLDAWSKVQLGFIEPQTVTSTGDYMVNSISAGSSILKIPTSDPNQYFLVENRELEGFDRGLSSYITNGGIAIWHIDDAVNASGYGVNDNEYHKGVDLEEASEGILGYSQLDRKQYYPKYDHYYYLGGVSSFDPSTTPNSKLYNGNDTNITISVQSSSSSSMKANVTYENVLPVIGGIDKPTDNEIINGNYEIKGWVLDGTGVNRIEVLVDDKIVGHAVYGDLREDIAIKYEAYNNKNSGFHFILDTKTLKDGEHKIKIRETGVNGLIALLPEVTAVTSNYAPSVSSTLPNNYEENISISNPVKVIFSEKVQRGDKFNQIKITDAIGALVSSRPSLDGNSMLILEPYVTLNFNTVYIVTIPAFSIKDLMGNPNTSEYTFRFKTMPYDPNIIQFKDPNLLNVIREELNKAQGDITRAEMESITYLDARGRGIYNLTGMESAINLDTLYMHGNQIEDITPLLNLSNLRVLELSGNHLDDISNIGTLINLEKLFLGDNNIIDITALKDLKKLQYLTLFSNKIKDVSVFDNMPNLVSIMIQDNNISDLTPITNKTNLKELSISLGSRTDLSSLSKLINLESLTFDGDYLKDISVLSSFTKLDSLSMWRTQVSDITPIAGLTGLTWLNMDYSLLQDISPIKNLNGLRYLSLNGNKIVDISPLSSLLNLNTLELNSNEIRDLTPLVENKNRGGFDTSDQRVEIHIRYNYLDLTPGSKASSDIDYIDRSGIFIYYTPQRDPNTFNILKITPGDFPLDAPRDLTASVQFNRNIKKGSSFSNITYKDRNGRNVEYSATITGDTIYIKPVGNLGAAMHYWIFIPSGAILDDSGSSYDSDINIDFGTVDDVAPVISYTSPKADSNFFRADSSIYLYFSEEIIRGPAFDNIVLKDSKGEFVSIDKFIDGNSVALQPIYSLEEGAQYTVVVPQNSVMDGWGNVFENDYSFNFTTYAPNFVHITGIKLNAASLKLGLNQQQRLYYTLTPFDASNKNVSWRSSDEAVAVVNGDGTVRAVGKGTADIIVKTVDGGFEAISKVTVIPVETIKINKTSLSIKAGYKTKLSATAYPTTAINKEIVWESSDESVVRVDSYGNIVSIMDGTAVIYARAKENSNVFAQCSITVETPVTSIKLNKTSITLSTTEGYNTTQLQAIIGPENATNKNVMWESSNPNVAIVDNGIVKAVGPGKAVIKAATVSGNKTSKCTVTVAPVTDVKLSKTQMSLTVGKSIILKPTITPSNAAVKDVRWEVTEGQSIIVTKFGKIIAVKNGLSKLRVTTADGGHSFDCEINVTGETVTLVNSLTLTNVKTGKNIGMLLVGKSATVSSSASGENKKTPTNKNLLWKSSDEKIAWVDDNGKVYGVAPGKVTITASTTDGSIIEKSVDIEVVQPIKSLTMEKTIRLQSNQGYLIKGLILPADFTRDGVLIKWTKTDKYGCISVDQNPDITIDPYGNYLTSVVQLNDDGTPYAGLKITALKKGTVKLTLSITTKDGTKKTVSTTLVIE